MLTLKRSPWQCRLDDAIERFELALTRDRSTRLADHLAGLSTEIESDRRIAGELICVDLEYRWQQGLQLGVSDYSEDFANWLACADVEAELTAAVKQLEDAHERARATAEHQVPGDLMHHGGDNSGSTQVGRAANDTDVAFPDRDLTRLVDIADSFPATGDVFGTFRLEEELGRGAFAVAFRARQIDLDDRPVVLKIAAAADLESKFLARLQHTHIMPIYSIHRHRGWQAICMPFVGRETLDRRLLALDRRGEGFTEFETIQIVRQLADGLRHAHQRGILHRDLKPANVLLGDDGLARLLDFNLSQDVLAGGTTCAVVGGTLPYLAPEHLESVLSGAPLDMPSDIYSLGVIWFQMLTQRLPFPHRRGALVDMVHQMIADRRERRQEWRGPLAAFSPAVGSMLDRMLAPHVNQRYHSIDELCEDLDCHVANRPLRYAPNRSTGERLRKWCRRHPRWSSATTVFAVSGVLIGSLVVMLLGHQRSLEHERAVSQLQAVRAKLPTLRALISHPAPDQATRKRTREVAHQIADDFQLLSDFDWSHSPWARQLHGADRAELQQVIAEDLYALTTCELRDMETLTSSEARQAAFDRSQRIVARSQQLIAADHPVHAALQAQTQRLRALQTLHVPQFNSIALLQTQHAQEHAEHPPVARDMILSQFERGEYESIVARLELERQRQPQDVSTLVLLGNAQVGLGRWDEAELAYTAVITLLPDADWAWFYRGLCRAQMGQPRAAAADFSRALELHPAFVSAWVNRAVVKRDLQQWQSAEDDLNRAIQLDDHQSHFYLLRSEIRHRLHNSAGAEEDRQRGLALEPQDESGYVQRGLVWLRLQQIDNAQGDFDRALRFDPHSHLANRNLAHLYAERLKQPERALHIISNLIAWHHGQPQDIVSRGVLLARLGKYEEAIADARRLAQQQPDAKTMFQIGCIHALSSGHHSEEAALATAWIERAITSDARWWEVAQQDTDLDSVRTSDGFRKMMETTREQLGRRAMVERDAAVGDQE